MKRNDIMAFKKQYMAYSSTILIFLFPCPSFFPAYQYLSLDHGGSRTELERESNGSIFLASQCLTIITINMPFSESGQATRTTFGHPPTPETRLAFRRTESMRCIYNQDNPILVPVRKIKHHPARIYAFHLGLGDDISHKRVSRSAMSFLWSSLDLFCIKLRPSRRERVCSQNSTTT